MVSLESPCKDASIDRHHIHPKQRPLRLPIVNTIEALCNKRAAWRHTYPSDGAPALILRKQGCFPPMGMLSWCIAAAHCLSALLQHIASGYCHSALPQHTASVHCLSAPGWHIACVGHPSALPEHATLLHCLSVRRLGALPEQAALANSLSTLPRRIA
jgi:hypothetical protein